MIQNLLNDLLVEPVQTNVGEVLASLRATYAGGGASGDSAAGGIEALIVKYQLEQKLPELFALSPYLMGICKRYPESLESLLNEAAFEPATTSPTVPMLTAEIEDACSALELSNGVTALSEDIQIKTLRVFRHREMLRILWRDLFGLDSLDDTLLALSSMADACIQVASKWAHQSIAKRCGQARDVDGNVQSMLVLGMGKLGGQELNVSSDIDLIYLFAENGNSDGKRSVENRDYFRQVAQLTTRLLGTVTEDGFAFRVDTRLRPFGESGPLVMNFAGLEQYYLTQGRDWERYAMIKARPIVFDKANLDAFNQLLSPFVYRRYLDYSAIESLRELKRKIALSVKQKSMQQNIKLGIGGIREIEFIGQAFQLVRGGRQERLRQRPIKVILHTLNDMKLMPAEDVQLLCRAYDFLRKIENALQCMRDQQVHTLPSADEDKQRLIYMMGFADWESFTLQLQRHRDVVAQRFDNLFSDWDDAAEGSDVANHQGSENENTAAVAWAVISSIETEEGAANEAMVALGIEPEPGLMENLIGLCRGGFYQRLTARAQGRLDRILPLLIDACLEQDEPAPCLRRCLNLVQKVAGRSGYLQILIERPPALARLVTLFARSDWVAEFVARHPIVIDELLRDTSADTLPDKAQLLAEAMHEAGRLKALELDEQMDSMRQFQQARELRVAVAELIEDLPLMRVSDQLSWLAEAVVQAVYVLVEAPLVLKHGKPACVVDGNTMVPEVAIVAYGKLGGLELGYGSDLDLVFLHNSQGSQQQTDGDKPVDNGFYYARLAQKIVHFMSTLTPAGVLYDIDLRLRPNGQSGVLVTGLEAFKQYQQNDAWTWEHQALVRARAVMGSEKITDDFGRIRREILCLPRDTLQLRDDVTNMRQRMRDNLKTGGDGQMHLKHDPGGVGDIEFIVQFLALAHAEQRHELVQYSDNIRILEAFAEAGIVSETNCETLQSHYKELRSLLHRQSLQSLGPVVLVDEVIENIKQQVIELWAEIFDLHG